MAYFLFQEAPAQLDSKWTGLLDAFISLHRRRHPNKQAAAGIPKATVDDFYDALDDARAGLTAGTLHDLLTIMARTRDHAEHLQSLLNQPGTASVLDSHIPSIASMLRRWADPSLPVRLLHDECPAVLTEELLGGMERQVAHPDDEWLHLVSPVALLPTQVGSSRDHPSLQLADPVAGAGREVGLWLAHDRPADPVAEALARILLPFIDANQSVWKEPLPVDCYDG